MKWEYKVITLSGFLNSDDDLTTEEKLNKYGADEWELVGVLEKPYVTVGNPPNLNCDSLVFKRAIG